MIITQEEYNLYNNALYERLVLAFDQYSYDQTIAIFSTLMDFTVRLFPDEDIDKLTIVIIKQIRDYVIDNNLDFKRYEIKINYQVKNIK